MLSNHDLSLQRISWGMAAVAVVTAAGLALTASGSRAAQQMAAITDKVESADFARLTDLVKQPATATAMASAPTVAEAPAAPVTPAAPATPAVRSTAESWAPAVPPEPVVPAADMIAPVPPTPPAPPVVRQDKGRLTVTHANGHVETHRIPTQADIARMVPDIDVREGCDGNGGQMQTRREWVDASGQRHIRVRICNAAIEAQAHRAELAAGRAETLARAQAARAERNGERAERMGKLAARRGLMNARIQIANSRMPAKDQADALRDIDDEIAAIDRGGN